MDQMAGEGGLQDMMDKEKGQGKGQMVLEEGHQDQKGKWMVQEKAQEQGLEREKEMVQMVQGEVHPNLKDKGKDQERDQMVRDWDHQDQEEDQESQVIDQGVVYAEVEVVVHMGVLDHMENTTHQRSLNTRFGLFLHLSNWLIAN